VLRGYIWNGKSSERSGPLPHHLPAQDPWNGDKHRISDRLWGDLELDHRRYHFTSVVNCWVGSWTLHSFAKCFAVLWIFSIAAFHCANFRFCIKFSFGRVLDLRLQLMPPEALAIGWDLPSATESWSGLARYVVILSILSRYHKIDSSLLQIHWEVRLIFGSLQLWAWINIYCVHAEFFLSIVFHFVLHSSLI